LFVQFDKEYRIQKGLEEITSLKSNNHSSEDRNITPEEYMRILIEKKRTNLKLEDIGFKCPKCGKNTGTLRQEQLRRGDEGDTSVMRCTNCGNTW
jgi:DNA-directed RNA polymerase subunit M/transcription elongation factor TFIIS